MATTTSLRLGEPVTLVKPSLTSLFLPRFIPTTSLPPSLHPRACSLQKTTHTSSFNRRHLISQTASLSLSLSIATTLYQQPAKSEETLSAWERVYLPIDPGVVLLDIAFVPDDLNHGIFCLM